MIYTKVGIKIKIPLSLIKTENLIYNLCNLKYRDLFIDYETAKYDGCFFKINNLKAIYRCGKVTPTKLGQFVTFYQRKHKNAEIEPFASENDFDLFIVSTFFGNNFGQFVFPKDVLIQHDIVSVNKQGGKRAFRIYSPWDKVLNKQATNTQKWQLPYFIDCTNKVDIPLVLKLYGNK